ncbi:pectate lyase [Natronolimnobius sp. AArcel1]|uniref:pectate lyase n=1 Tax=Natronolimnobius sp. AArcel1 TaxID=1679093 RepID=UPI0013EA9FF4|nr:pectate lyase [Natronolimnobius sp. AArcel1]NGM68835.1 pectate lyase [Natronolimnobius sp. AArcel1]
MDRRSFLHTVGAAGLGAATLENTQTITAQETRDNRKVVTIDNIGTESPSSPIAPDDGFADLSWLEEGPLVVVRVTNLDAAGEGSFKWACEVGYDELDAEDVGRRLIVFEVGGVIDLENTDIQAERTNIYVAGQTAPSPGITLIRADSPGLEFDEENQFVQHIRSRPGDEIDGPSDSMVVGDNGFNVCFDHCSVSWGSEESMSVNASEHSEDITFSNNLIAEGLFDSPAHGSDNQRAYGSLVGNGADRTAILGNLYAHTWSRNPRLKGGTEATVANNVWYNFERGMRIGDDVDEPTFVNVVGNHYRTGPDADTDRPLIYTNHDENDPTIYLHTSNNVSDDGYTLVEPDAPWEIESEPIEEYWPENFTPIDDDPYDQVRSHAGARPADKTDTDERILADVENRTGTIIDSQDDVGGYPELESTTRDLEVPDGDVTDWLVQHTRAVELGEAPPGEGGSRPPEIGGTQPTDPNGDGAYTDLTGDGQTTHDDVTVFFEHLEDEGVQNNPEAFDFAENDEVGFADVVALLRQV